MPQNSPFFREIIKFEIEEKRFLSTDINLNRWINIFEQNKGAKLQPKSIECANSTFSSILYFILYSPLFSPIELIETLSNEINETLKYNFYSIALQIMENKDSNPIKISKLTTILDKYDNKDDLIDLFFNMW